jgi:hypothetical protein
VALERLIFIDQSRINLESAPTHGLSPAGTPVIIWADKPEQWEPRIDFMGAVCGKQQLAFETKTDEQRRKEGVKGWTKAAVLSFIRLKVAPAVVKVCIEGAVVVVDKALKISGEDVHNAMVAGGAEDAKCGVVLPTASAKYVSPLDNTMWHQVKESIRAKQATSVTQLVQVIRRAWLAVTPEQIHAYYKHCALARGDDPFSGQA